MDFRLVATLASLLSAAFGIGFLLAPTASAAMHGITLVDPGHLLVGRYFGAELLIYAAATWALRGLADPAAQRSGAGVLALATTCGLGVSLLGTIAGTLNALGWSSVALWAFFVLAWGRLALAGGGAPRPLTTR